MRTAQLACFCNMLDFHKFGHIYYVLYFLDVAEMHITYTRVMYIINYLIGSGVTCGIALHMNSNAPKYTPPPNT